MIPHFQYPFAFNARGQSKVVEQDSPGDLEARAANVCVCPIGFREDQPEYGIPELLFGTIPLDISTVQEEVARWANLDVEVTEHAKALEVATRLLEVGVS